MAYWPFKSEPDTFSIDRPTRSGFEADKVRQGGRDYRWRQPDHVTVMNEISLRYREVGIAMSYTNDDFHRDSEVESLKRLPPDELLRGLPIEDCLCGLPLEDRLLGLDDAGRARLQEFLDGQETADQRHVGLGRTGR